MSQFDKEKEILIQLVEDLSEFDSDHLALMSDLDLSSEQIARWRISRNKLNKVKDDFDNLLIVRAGGDPIF